MLQKKLLKSIDNTKIFVKIVSKIVNILIKYSRGNTNDSKHL